MWGRTLRVGARGRHFRSTEERRTLVSRCPTERSRCLCRYASYDLLAYPADQLLCPHVQRVARVMWAHTMSKDSAGEEEGTSDDSRGEGTDADTPALMPHSIHLADTGSGTRLRALLTSPFDQLASPGLRAAAHAHHLQHAAQPDTPTTPPTAGDEPTSSTTRTTPTLVGERCSTSGTASQPVSTGVGSGKSLLVREKGLEPSRPKAPGPKPGASTNSATRAVRRLLYRPGSRIAECGDRCCAHISPLSPRPVRRAAA